MKNYFLLGFISFFTVTFQMSVKLETDKVFCVWKDFEERTINTFSFVVSGRNERNVEIKVKIKIKKVKMIFSFLKD